MLNIKNLLSRVRSRWTALGLTSVPRRPTQADSLPPTSALHRMTRYPSRFTMAGSFQ